MTTIEQYISNINYALENETTEQTSFGRLSVVKTEALQAALAALRAQAEREAETWIPVSVRLPVESDTDKDRDFCVLGIHKATTCKCFHWRSVANSPFDFDYWRPLPKPPKEPTHET